MFHNPFMMGFIVGVSIIIVIIIAIIIYFRYKSKIQEKRLKDGYNSTVIIKPPVTNKGTLLYLEKRQISDYLNDINKFYKAFNSAIKIKPINCRTSRYDHIYISSDSIVDNMMCRVDSDPNVFFQVKQIDISENVFFECVNFENILKSHHLLVKFRQSVVRYNHDDVEYFIKNYNFNKQENCNKYYFFNSNSSFILYSRHKPTKTYDINQSSERDICKTLTEESSRESSIRIVTWHKDLPPFGENMWQYDTFDDICSVTNVSVDCEFFYIKEYHNGDIFKIIKKVLSEKK